MRKMHKLSFLLVALVCSTNIATADADSCCPFCSAVSQTLRQEMEAMDAVAIAKIVKGSETEADAEFEMLSVIRGDNLIRVNQKARMNYFGKAPEGTQFLVMGVDPPDLLWSSPLPVSEKVIDYVKTIVKLPEDPIKRIEFYHEYLENTEAILARDAYDEFASAPYDDLKKLKPKMNREKLLGWIDDNSLPPDRKRLYLVLLGICGKPEDAKFLESMLRSEDPNRRAGLDAMIACYVTLLGDDGLKLIDELFLANKKSQYADTYAAIMALRFHGTDGGIISKERVLTSMQLILQRPELADLVIPDLARWEDWSQIDRLVELFKTADEKSSWVRVPVINYLRACPKPEASAKLDELKEIDPAAFKRATSFFPVPQPAAPATKSSSVASPIQTRSLAVSDVPLMVRPNEQVAAGGSLASSAVVASVEPNRAFVISVISMVSLTLWLAMWLAISGAGKPSVVAFALAVKNDRR
jgi:hypothetical protein